VEVAAVSPVEENLIDFVFPALRRSTYLSTGLLREFANGVPVEAPLLLTQRKVEVPLKSGLPLLDYVSDS
jgi:hypothetical protein